MKTRLRVTAMCAFLMVGYGANAWAACPALTGDVNLDGALTITDVSCTIHATLADAAGMAAPACLTTSADLDCSGNLSVSDITLAITRVLGLPLNPAIDSDSDHCPDGCEADSGPSTCTGAACNAPVLFQAQSGPGFDPTVFRTMQSNIFEFPGGFDIEGEVAVETPFGDYPLVEVQLTLKSPDNDPLAITDLSGSAYVSLPGFGPFAGLGDTTGVLALVTYDLGSDIPNLDAPLHPDRRYLVFSLSKGTAGTTADGTGITLSDSKGILFVLDPADPGFFARADVDFDTDLGTLTQVAVGASAQGLIPFTPLHTWMAEDHVTEFSGHLYAGGKFDLFTEDSVELFSFPVPVDGELVIDLDPDADGFGFDDTDEEPEIHWGINGKMSLILDFLGLYAAELPIAKGSATGRHWVSNPGYSFSGIVEPGQPIFPPSLPLDIVSKAQVAGHYVWEQTDFYFVADAVFALETALYAEMLGVELNALSTLQGTLYADATGIDLTATTTASISPWIALGAEAAFHAHYSTDDPTDWFIELQGELLVDGLSLGSNARLTIDSTGVYLEGIVQAGAVELGVSGTIDSSGVLLVADAAIDFDVIAGNSIVQTVVDGAICGYQQITSGAQCGWQTVTSVTQCGWESVTSAAVCGKETITSAAQCGTATVTSAAQCGSQWVTSGAACGYETVSSAAQCGYNTVTSGAQCGWSTITSAAQCGYDTVTSAAQCGTESITSASQCGYDTITSGAICGWETFGCWLNPFNWGTCSEPQSCQVPASCTVASTCSVPASCTVANTCSVPASCTVPDSCWAPSTCNIALQCTIASTCEIPATCNQPQTCDDLTNPLTCETTVNLDEYDFGSVEAGVTIDINASGTTATLAGTYCTDDGCFGSISGTLSLDSSGQACVTLPDVGAYCTTL